MSAARPVAHADGLWVAFENVTLPLAGTTVFPATNWIFQVGQQWAILGPSGSGKSLFVQAVLGKIWPVTGEIHHGFHHPDGTMRDAQDAIGWVSAAAQRELIRRESSFYQSRWHSGIEEGENTVARYLSQAVVEELNPFEVGARLAHPKAFARRRRELCELLDIAGLMRRKILHLSNGEQRKVLLAHTLLRNPQMLVLDDPLAGLDARSRPRVRRLLNKLARAGLPMLFIGHRWDELPGFITHVLVVRDHQVIAQGTKAEVRQRMPELAAKTQVNPSQLRRAMFSRATDPSKFKTVLQVCHLNVAAGRKRILRDINWTVAGGEHWAILGPNGSGKTTLLNVIQGDHPQVYAQDLCLFDQPLATSPALWRWRQKISSVSPELHQHYPPDWPCLAVVCSGYFGTLGLHQPCSRARRQQALAWLAEFGLADAAKKVLGELSPGHQRLVLIARAMVKQPWLLILDEPCQGLDGWQRHAILAAVDRIVEQTGTQVLFVTHHPNEMPACITHVLRLKAGRCVGQSRRVN